MSITVSAPGKVILFGDHSVVYNRRAIAASITLRTTLVFEKQPNPGLCLDFPDIKLHLIITSEDLILLHASSPALTGGLMPSGNLNHDLIHKIEEILAFKQMETVAQAAAVTFLYLYLHLRTELNDNAFGTYTLTSELPIGAGLGSSASVSAVIATTFLLLSETIAPPAIVNLNGTGKTVLELINRWAYVGEQCIHGTPSGVDNTVAVFGRAVAFQKTEPIQLIELPSLPLLLTNTGVARSTKAQVSGVASLRQTLPGVIEPILDAMHQIAVEAQNLLPEANTARDKIGPLITINQGLLRTLGVSHPAIEAVVERNKARGWTKLVGAGGGGCVITLLREGQEVGPEVCSGNDDGLEEYIISLGGPGVGIHTGAEISHYEDTS